jgi:hypothetical protein
MAWRNLEKRRCDYKTGRQLAHASSEEQSVRIVTIKRPPLAFDGVTQDNFHLGDVYEVSPHLGILLTAAGWVRSETRTHLRREGAASQSQEQDRRRLADRRYQPPIQH